MISNFSKVLLTEPLTRAALDEPDGLSKGWVANECVS